MLASHNHFREFSNLSGTCCVESCHRISKDHKKVRLLINLDRWLVSRSSLLSQHTFHRVLVCLHGEYQIKVNFVETPRKLSHAIINLRGVCTKLYFTSMLYLC